MNKVRRKQIENIKEDISVIMDRLREVLDDEQYYFDNIPENLSCSERAETSEEAIGIMEEAVDSLEEVVDSLEEIV